MLELGAQVLGIAPDRHDGRGLAAAATWLDRHPRFVLQYTPTSASWLNAVEGFFAKLNRHRLERGVFHSIVDRPLWAGERTRYAGGVLC